MCVELFFLYNQLMDFSILAAVSRSMGCFRFSRIWLAATLGAGYAVLGRLQPLLTAAPIQFILLIPLSILTVGRSPWRMALSVSLSLPVTALAAGACADKLCTSGFTLPMLLLPPALTTGVRLRRSTLSVHPTTIEVGHLSKSIRFPACVDTGNHLSEPLTGQPVLIASASLIRQVLPASGFRQVAYGSVGGSGTLPCFHPDRLYIWENGVRRRAPQAWIAVYPGRIPGAFQALAPAVFAIT